MQVMNHNFYVYAATSTKLDKIVYLGVVVLSLSMQQQLRQLERGAQSPHNFYHNGSKPQLCGDACYFCHASVLNPPALS